LSYPIDDKSVFLHARNFCSTRPRSSWYPAVVPLLLGSVDVQLAGEFQPLAINPTGRPGKKEAVMLNLIKKLVREEGGQDLAEYGIALAVIAIGAAAIAVAIGGDVNTLWSNAQGPIADAAASN